MFSDEAVTVSYCLSIGEWESPLRFVAIGPKGNKKSNGQQE